MANGEQVVVVWKFSGAQPSNSNSVLALFLEFDEFDRIDHYVTQKQHCGKMGFR